MDSKKDLNRVCRDAFHGVMDRSRSGRVDNNKLITEAVTAVRDELGDDLGDLLLKEYVGKQLTDYNKTHHLSSILAGQKELFPDAVLEGTISAEGVTVKLGSANFELMALQERRIIDDKVKKDRSFVRSMDFFAGVRGSSMADNPSLALADVWDEIKRDNA